MNEWDRVESISNRTGCSSMAANTPLKADLKMQKIRLEKTSAKVSDSLCVLVPALLSPYERYLVQMSNYAEKNDS